MDPTTWIRSCAPWAPTSNATTRRWRRSSAAAAGIRTGTRSPGCCWRLPLLLPALLLPPRVVLGLLAMLLILASPLFVCWLCAGTDGPATGRT